MFEQIKEIAQRMKDLRDISGFSALEMAKKINVDEAEYVNYENGVSDIPLSVLTKVANICGIEMSELLTGEKPKLHIFSVTRKDKRLQVERNAGYKHESLAFNFSNKKAEPFMVTLEPHKDDSWDSASLHSHEGQEFDFVMEGTLRFLINGNEIVLEEGDSLIFDSKYLHGMKAEGGPVKFLAIVM